MKKGLKVMGLLLLLAFICSGCDAMYASTTRDIRQDEDSSYYNYFKVDQKYSFTYKENQTHIYYLIIEFPTTYKDIIEYSDAIDNIQVKINTQQVL